MDGRGRRRRKEQEPEGERGTKKVGNDVFGN